MEKDTKYFIGVVIILLIAVFSSSLNLTGKSVSDITGMTISGATCTARSDTNYANPKSYNSDCGKAYDASTTSALIMGSNFQGWVSNAEIILNFASAKDIGKISILPYGALTNAKLYFNDETTPQNLGSVASGQRSEFTPDKKTGINKIKITWTFIGGYQSGIYDLGISEGVSCNDPDGRDYYLKSCGTGTTATGTVYTSSNPLCDSCADVSLLYEVVCSTTTGYLQTINTNRLFGEKCENGALVVTSCKGKTETQCKADSNCLWSTGLSKCDYNVAGTVTCSASNCDKCTLKTDCIANNPTADTFGCGSLTTSPSCSANANCEWFNALEGGGFVSVPAGGGATGNVVAVAGTGKKPCQPKTKCVWTYDEKSANLGHCCGDKEYYETQFGICKSKSADLCYSFYPPNLEEGKGVKLAETPKKACHNVGSVAYGFWVPVTQY